MAIGCETVETVLTHLCIWCIALSLETRVATNPGTKQCWTVINHSTIQ